jgi:hypothetical protein
MQVIDVQPYQQDDGAVATLPVLARTSSRPTSWRSKTAV